MTECNDVVDLLLELKGLAQQITEANPQSGNIQIAKRMVDLIDEELYDIPVDAEEIEAAAAATEIE